MDWLADACVDVVVLALVLHHLARPVDCLRELRRVLRPQGRLVVSTVHPTADWRQLGGSYFSGERLDDVWNDGWQVRFRRQPLEALVQDFVEAGFLARRLVEPRPVPSLRRIAPTIFERLSQEPYFIAFELVPDPVLP